MRQEIEERLKHLYNQHGELTPELVVEDAMNPDSPLHGEFTWDKEKAAYKYLLVEARQLIKSVKINFTIEKTTVSAVAYTKNPSNPQNQQGYVSVEAVKNDHEMTRLILVQEFQRAGAALKRAQRLAKYFDLEHEVEQLHDQMQKLKEHAENYELT